VSELTVPAPQPPFRPRLAGVRHIVWDWNGTLFDDAAAVLAATQDVLAEIGGPAVDDHTYRTAYTRPVRRTYDRLLGRTVTEAEWERIGAGYLRHYTRHAAASGLSADAQEAIALAAGAGLSQSLLSMLTHDLLVDVVARLGLADAGTLVRIDGWPPGSSTYKADHLRVHLAALGLAGSEVALVGDSLDDLAAAESVGALGILYDGGAHHRHALEATGAPVTDTLTAAVDLLRAARSGAAPLTDQAD